MPGGAVGTLQFHDEVDAEAAFSGNDNLAVNEDGEIVHDGNPIHDEEQADFKDGSANSFARAQWPLGATTDDTPTAIATISIPAAEIGDCFVTVHAEVTYFYESSGTKGGNYSMKATFKRSSGTLTRINTLDLSVATLATGAAPAGIDVDVDDDDTIIVEATGIDSTDITWITSLHVQAAVPPT